MTNIAAMSVHTVPAPTAYASAILEVGEWVELAAENTKGHVAWRYCEVSYYELGVVRTRCGRLYAIQDRTIRHVHPRPPENERCAECRAAN